MPTTTLGWGSRSSQSEIFHVFPTQREKDDESGLLHYRARSYDPRTGRFVQSEALTSRKAHDHYRYADGTPASVTDPTGYDAEQQDYVKKLRATKQLTKEEDEVARAFNEADFITDRLYKGTSADSDPTRAPSPSG